jgi:hypothetical protein
VQDCTNPQVHAEIEKSARIADIKRVTLSCYKTAISPYAGGDGGWNRVLQEHRQGLERYCPIPTGMPRLPMVGA